MVGAGRRRRCPTSRPIHHLEHGAVQVFGCSRQIFCLFPPRQAKQLHILSHVCLSLSRSRSISLFVSASFGCVSQTSSSALRRPDASTGGRRCRRSRGTRERNEIASEPAGAPKLPMRLMASHLLLLDEGKHPTIGRNDRSSRRRKRLLLLNSPACTEANPIRAEGEYSPKPSKNLSLRSSTSSVFRKKLLAVAMLNCCQGYRAANE